MNNYLLDTNMLVLHLRGEHGVPTLLGRWSQSHELYISVTTRVEILAGMRPAEESVTIHLLNSMNSLPVSQSIADRAGRLIYEQARRGHQVSFPDALIAATTLEHDLTLVTTNARHFPMLDKQITPLADHLPVTE
jgi:tRNA(fMet)-specific endonuclease VapC